MTLEETMTLLASKGTEQTKKTYRRHGAPEPFFGVKIGDMKPILKMVKGDTNCKVPDAASYIIKSLKGLPVAPMHKTTKC